MEGGRFMSERTVPYEIVKEIAVLKEGSNLWRKELNLVRWNGGAPKYDVRWWSPDRGSPGKGITFVPEELHQLADIVVGLPRTFHQE